MIGIILAGIIVNIISLYLTIVLFSSNPSDPGWMQSIWDEPIYNMGGLMGARVADFLFFTVGYIAYIIPFFILLYFWKFFFRTIDLTVLICFVKLLQMFLFLLVFCGLIQLTFEDSLYFSSGGIIGSILYTIIKGIPYIIWDIDLSLTFIGIISIIFFFRKKIIHFIKIIYRKIMYIIVFMLKKCKKNHMFCLKQTYYNTHMHSSFSLTHINVISKQVMCDFVKDHEKRVLNKNFNVIDKFKKLLQLCMKNTQYQNIIRYWVNRYKFNNNYLKYFLDNTKSVNLDDFCNKKKININLNQYLKKDLNNFEILSLFGSKNLYERENVSNKHINQSCFNISRDFIQEQPTVLDLNCCNKISSKLKISSVNTKTNKKSCNYVYKHLPNIDLLISNDEKKSVDYLKLKKIAQLIEKKLLEYRISANVVKIISGPVITCFELNLSAGIKSSKISNLSRDLARSLSVISVRVVEVIPGTPYVGLEIPNEIRNTVYLRDLIKSDKFKQMDSPLSLVLGKDIFGNPVVEDLKCMPHLLIAGTTGSGKSIGINTMIISILYKSTPEDVRFIMIDPKILELSIYSKIPHLLREVITDTQEVESVLQWCVSEMESRYKIMSMFGVRNLESYNNQIKKASCNPGNINNNKSLFQMYKKLPYIIIIIDELADLMMATDKKVEMLITRLTQKARASGIHLILSTQRPSVDVITGLIKSNIPARIAFSVSSKIDSRTILGQPGAESLLGMGDMLYLSPNSSILRRIHGTYVQDQEIYNVVNFWKYKNKKN